MLSPANVTEKLKSIWKQILAIDDFAEDAEFFDLGGTSMLVIEMLAEVSGLYEAELDFMAFLEDPRFDRLVAMIQPQTSAGVAATLEPDAQTDRLKFPGAGVEVSIPELLQMCRPHPDDTVFVAGSLVEGLGNQYSDIDVYVLTSRRRTAADLDIGRFHRVLSPDRVRLTPDSREEVFIVHTLLPGTNVKLDIEFTQFSELDVLFQDVETLFAYAISSPSLLSKRFTHRSEMLMHRLCTGRPIFNRDLFSQIAERTPRRQFEYLGYRWLASDFSIMLDLVGALKTNDNIRALDIARDNLVAHIHGLLHLLGLTNTKRKWLPRYLDMYLTFDRALRDEFLDLFLFRGADVANPGAYVGRTLDLIDRIELHCREVLERTPEFPSGDAVIARLRATLLPTNGGAEGYAEWEYEYRAKAYRSIGKSNRDFLDM
jgi:hypothetical protein